MPKIEALEPVYIPMEFDEMYARLASASKSFHSMCDSLQKRLDTTMADVAAGHPPGSEHLEEIRSRHSVARSVLSKAFVLSDNLRELELTYSELGGQLPDMNRNANRPLDFSSLARARAEKLRAQAMLIDRLLLPN